MLCRNIYVLVNSNSRPKHGWGAGLGEESLMIMSPEDLGFPVYTLINDGCIAIPQMPASLVLSLCNAHIATLAQNII